MEELGTPKSLREAIEREICMAPAKDVVQRLEAAVKDYLSQAFTTALLTARSPEEQKVLTNLWASIFQL